MSEISKSIKRIHNKIKSAYSEINIQTIPHIHVGPSLIHGSGLFADEYIAKDTIITYYPITIIKIGDIITAENNDPTLIHSIMDLDGSIDNTYAYNLDNNIIIYGLKDRTDNKTSLGHMINDSGNNIFSGKDVTDIIKFKNALAEYYISSKKHTNCKYVVDDYIVKIIATKPIEINQEILAEYGPEYWYKKTYERTDFKSIYNRLMKHDNNFCRFMNNIKK